MKNTISLYIFMGFVALLVVLSPDITLVDCFLMSNLSIGSKSSAIRKVFNFNTQLSYRRPKPSQNEPKISVIKKGIKIRKDIPININNIPSDIAEVLNYYSISEYYKLKQQGDDEETFQYCFDYFQDLVSAKVLVKGMRSLGMER